MPDPKRARSQQIVAVALMPSALLLGGGAVAIYSGAVDLVADDARGIVAAALGLAAVMDFLVALWFFRMSQSS